LQKLSEVIEVPILSGVLVEEIAVTTTAKKVPHKLGRRARGWIVVRNNANSVVYDNSAPDGEFLDLVASAAATISIWVF